MQKQTAIGATCKDPMQKQTMCSSCINAHEQIANTMQTQTLATAIKDNNNSVLYMYIGGFRGSLVP